MLRRLRERLRGDLFGPMCWLALGIWYLMAVVAKLLRR